MPIIGCFVGFPACAPFVSALILTTSRDPASGKFLARRVATKQVLEEMLSKTLSLVALLGFGMAATFPLQSPRGANPPGTRARALVTAEARRGGEPPDLTPNDIQVFEGKDQAPVAELLPIRGEHAGLDLLILLDDGSGWRIDTQLNDIRNFINTQPKTTAIGVGYMRNGTVQFTSQFTTDHAQASKAIRIPLGETGVNGSPYFSLSDAVKKWKGGNERREVLMITDGIDRYGYGSGLNDPYVNASISDAQKAGVVVFSIYTSGAGHFGHSFWRNSWG